MRSNEAKRLFGIVNYPNPLTCRHLRGPYSQTEMAAALGTRAKSVTDWETGRTAPSPSALRVLLDHYRKWTANLSLPTWDLLLAAHTKGRRPQPWQPTPSPSTRTARRSLKRK